MKQKLAIIGSHPRTRADFDFTRTDVDVWMFNEAVSNKANDWVKRADAIFQLHVEPIWKNPQNRNDPKHYEWLKTQTEVPTVYMQDVYAEIPTSKKYPLEEVKALVQHRKDHFLTSSVPMAMGLAAYLKQYDRIEIYGVAMETNTEWQFQREGVAFWRGYLEGMGVDVYFADPTFEAPLYGYEGEVFIKEDKFEGRVTELMPAYEKSENDYKAKYLELQTAIKAFANDGSKDNEEALLKKMEAAREAVNLMGNISGSIQENKRYLGKAKEMKDVAGEFVFSRQEFESGVSNLSKKRNEIGNNVIALGVNLGNLHKAVQTSAKNSPKREKLVQGFIQTMQKYMLAVNEAAVYNGAASENQYYMQYLDKYIRAAGGAKAEEVLLNVVA